ncbi:MAG: hypothetical protein ACYTG2_08935 [Planctomycetota bacterium]
MPTAADARTPPATALPSPTRRATGAWLALLTAAGFALRAWNSRAGLPDVLHSDWAQVRQAAELLRDGAFVDRTVYPAVHTFVVAGVDALVGVVGQLLGAWPDWHTFVERLAGPSLGHAIARGYNAVLGAALAPAVYALARVHLGRGASLLAAAIAALDPMQILLSHQARIHVPGVTLLVLASTSTAPAVRRPGLGAALAAGAAAGAVASVFQLGFLLAGAGGLCTLLRVRPLTRGLGQALGLAAGFGLCFGALIGATRLTGAVQLPPGREAIDDALTLGMHATAVVFQPRNILAMLIAWIAVEPVRALALLPGLRRSGLGGVRARELALFLVYPLIVLAVIGGGIGPQPRYSLSCTPFLAVPMAAACLALPGRRARAVLAGLLVLAPLAGSIRHDVLRGRPDTRVALADVLDGLSADGQRVAVESRLVLPTRRLPPGAARFPPGGDYRAWAGDVEARRAVLAAVPARILACSLATRVALSADERVMETLGWRLADTIEPGRSGHSLVPNDPGHLVPDLWLATRPGPRIELWERRD